MFFPTAVLPARARRDAAMSTGSESDDDVFVMLDGDGRVYGVEYDDMEFGFRAFRDFLPSEHVGALVADAAVIDSPMCPASTFWVACEDMAQPRCALEALAGAIFRTHTREMGVDAFDRGTSGAEWWVQTGKRVGLHWDKDEACREKSGIFVHPALSTVTYLTEDTGDGTNAPTLVFENVTVPEIARHGGGVPGNLQPDPRCRRVVASWPKRGKHVAFDGRLLHGVFPELSTPAGGNSRGSGGSRSFRRVTFLVNVWLNHQPRDVRRLPEDVAKALTRIDETDAFSFSPKTCSPAAEESPAGVARDGNAAREPLRDRFFGWSGDEMRLEGTLPLLEMREAGATKGGIAAVDLNEDEAMRVVENALRDGDEKKKDERDAKRTRF